MKKSLLLLLLLFIFGCAKKNRGDQKHLSFDQLSKSKSILINQEINLNNKKYSLTNKKLIFKENGELANGSINCINCEITAPPKRIFKNVELNGSFNYNYGYLEWFLGNDFTNAFRNFNYLNVLIRNEFTIMLTNLVSIASETNISVANPHKAIKIIGPSNELAGLILETKHRNLFFNYFRSSTGFNLDFYNILITTRDFIKGLKNEKEADYFLTGSYYQEQFNPNAKPNIDSIKIINCKIQGNIALACYGSHSNNQSLEEYQKSNFINSLNVINCEFINCNSPFSFANMGFKNIIIKNNKIYDLSSAFLSIPVSGLNEKYESSIFEKNGLVIFEDNIFENTKVVSTPDNRTLSPCVIKGGKGSLKFINNTLENLLSSNPKSNVNTFYFTNEDGGFCLFKNNFIKNVIGRGSIEYPACVIKNRWSSNFIMDNNTVIIDRLAMVKLGIIEKEEDDLSKIDANTFYMDFFQNGGSATYNNSFHITNNIFKIPYINKSSEIYRFNDIHFSNNDIEIEHFGVSNINSTVSIDNSLFLARHRLNISAKQQPKNLIFQNNKFRISNIVNNKLWFINAPNGVQVSENNSKDKYFNFESLVFEDSFYLSNTNLIFSLPDAKHQKIKPTITGKSNSFTLDDFTDLNHLRPNAEKLESHIKIENASWLEGQSPAVFIPNSTQKIVVYNHYGEFIPIMSYIYFYTLYNLKNEGEILIEILFNGRDKSNKIIKVKNSFIVNPSNRRFYFLDDYNEIRQINPSDKSNQIENIKTLKYVSFGKQNIFKLSLVNGDRHLSRANLIYTGCSDISNYTILVQSTYLRDATNNPSKIRDNLEKSISSFD
jgi:hypothetical protein